MQFLVRCDLIKFEVNIFVCIFVCHAINLGMLQETSSEGVGGGQGGAPMLRCRAEEGCLDHLGPSHLIRVQEKKESCEDWV